VDTVHYQMFHMDAHFYVNQPVSYTSSTWVAGSTHSMYLCQIWKQ